MNTNIIKFYSKGEYYEFSNYYPAMIKIDNIEYYCSEVYYQAQKFNIENDTNIDRIEYFKLICEADSPQKSKDMGCQHVNFRGENWYINKNKPELGKMNDVIRKYKHIKIDPNWSVRQIDVMTNAIQYKFDQHPKLKEILIKTYPNDIMEDSPRDMFWGGTLNHLGKLLVKLRTQYLV